MSSAPARTTASLVGCSACRTAPDVLQQRCRDVSVLRLDKAGIGNVHGRQGRLTTGRRHSGFRNASLDALKP